MPILAEVARDIVTQFPELRLSRTLWASEWRDRGQSWGGRATGAGAELRLKDAAGKGGEGCSRVPHSLAAMTISIRGHEGRGPVRAGCSPPLTPEIRPISVQHPWSLGLLVSLGTEAGPGDTVPSTTRCGLVTGTQAAVIEETLAGSLVTHYPLPLHHQTHPNT